jgi:D-alanyl-D-alanine endopeptidase (penicillin-binding protein 7)
MRWLLSLLLCSMHAQAAVSAKSYIVMDMSGTVMIEKNADEERSIASITKLITTERASAQAAEELITIEPGDVKEGRMRSSPLKIGVAYPRAMLIQLALVSSDNVAALALGRNLPDGSAPPSIKVIESSGLDPENKSTARALANYARHLQNTDLAATSVLPVTISGTPRHNTNPLLLKRGWEFFLSKTGFINQSGGCLVVITKIKDQLVAVVILGSRDTRQRWHDLAELRVRLGDTEFASPEKRKKRRAR